MLFSPLVFPLFTSYIIINGATTVSITTVDIMTLRMMTLSRTMKKWNQHKGMLLCCMLYMLGCRKLSPVCWMSFGGVSSRQLSRRLIKWQKNFFSIVSKLQHCRLCLGLALFCHDENVSTVQMFIFNFYKWLQRSIYWKSLLPDNTQPHSVLTPGKRFMSATNCFTFYLKFQVK